MMRSLDELVTYFSMTVKSLPSNPCDRKTLVNEGIICYCGLKRVCFVCIVAWIPFSVVVVNFDTVCRYISLSRYK